MFSAYKEKGMPFQGLKPGLRRNVICLLSSIIFHALLFLIFINVASPIKVIQFEEVTDLIIVPPEELFLPEGYEDFPGTGQYDDPFLGRGQRERRFASREILPEVESAIVTEIPPPPERGASPSQMESEQTPLLKGRLTHRSELASDFKLRIPSESELDLSKADKKERQIGGDYEERKSINFSKYLHPDLSKILPSRGKSSSGRPGSRRAGRQARASFRVHDYDITPWAERVVNRIQSNWTIPLRQVALTSDVVGISVIVERNGELASVEILNSSRDQSLDQSALEAVKKSSPFPNLPADFPYKNLEALFVFQYYD